MATPTNHLVTSDPATGLRHGGIRWPQGTIPTPFGCRGCGYPENQHGFGHRWERPTRAQILARMLARRAQRQTRRELAVLGIPVIDTAEFLDAVRVLDAQLDDPSA